MRFEDRSEALVAESREAFERATGDVLAYAEDIAPRRTGRYAQSLHVTPPLETADGLSSRLGSPLASAEAKEKGAYIAAERWPTLVIKVGGSFRRPKAVRIPARPTVVPAGRRFVEFMGVRLREIRGQ